MTKHRNRWRLAPDAHHTPGVACVILPFPIYAQKQNRAGGPRQLGGQTAGHFQTGACAGRAQHG